MESVCDFEWNDKNSTGFDILAAEAPVYVMVESSQKMLQRQRQRKFHRRSRNGCFVCKRKHIRCDERRPLCTYCLRHGGECGYTDTDTGRTISDTEREMAFGLCSDPVPGELRETDDIILPLVDATPMDTFFGIGFDMPQQSRPLFQLFVSTKYCYTNPVPREPNSFVVHKALSHPGFLHGALLMTTLQWAWSTGDTESFHMPYLYHKLQAIRFVNEQLANPDTAVNDGTIAAVASLALVENALGSIDAVTSHLRGLARIKEIESRHTAPSKMGLVQRMIMMAARCLSLSPVWDILDISRTDYVHQSMIISLLRVALRPIYSLFTLNGSDIGESEPFSVLARKTAHPQPSDSITCLPGDDKKAITSTSIQSVDSSRSAFIACYFYLYIILREDAVDPFVLNWFVEQLLADVCRTEESMLKGEYSQSLWFWTVMFGACVTTAARATSFLEKEQMQIVRDDYMHKIWLVSEVLRIKDWEGAKSELRLFVWDDEFDGEAELKAIWEEAVGEDDEKRDKKHEELHSLRPIDPAIIGW